MGEQKRRSAARHLPPDGMANARGRALRDLARDTHDRAVLTVEHGHLEFEVMIGGLMSVAVDLLRANRGDAFAAKFVRDFAQQRLSRPMEYWGVGRNDPQ